MNYGKILYCDTANGPGLRTTLFVSGCRRHCPGCFNQETWDFSYGKPYTFDTLAEIIESLKNPDVDGLSILGGEPFEPENWFDIYCLTGYVKKMGKTIWVYSGYRYEELIENQPDHLILSHIDVLVDGPFIETEKDISLKFRGSRNQRIIDVQNSFWYQVALMEEYM